MMPNTASANSAIMRIGIGGASTTIFESPDFARLPGAGNLLD